MILQGKGNNQGYEGHHLIHLAKWVAHEGCLKCIKVLENME